MRFRPSITLSICLIAAMLAIAGLFRSGDPAAPPVVDAGTAAITIEGFAFSSLGATTPGVSITVTNADGAAHTLTAVNGEFDTGLIGGSGTASFAAPAGAGTYEFFCELHPSMTGTLTVG